MGAVLIVVMAALAVLCLWGASPGSPLGDRCFRAGNRYFRSTASEGAARAHGIAGGRGSAAPVVSGGVASVPLLLELLGSALDSGLTVQNALRVVAEVSEPGLRESLLRVVAGFEIGASWHNSWEGNLARGDVARIHDALSFGALTGASAAPLLYAEAKQCRTAAARTAEKRAAALGVKLVLPLGLCSLPAFIALGVVPVVMAMIPVL